MSKFKEGQVIEGGKVCADCGGHCCRGCAQAVGYFYQTMNVPDLKRFTVEELELIQRLRGNSWYHTANMPEEHPVIQLGKLLGVKFDKVHGFGGPTGCRLPREKRSRTCLRYFCDKLVKAFDIPQNVYWSQLTDEEMAANKEVYGEDHRWPKDPITRYIESIKAQKATV